ncbi:MAG TPA: hypothetical protein VGO68_02540 [Pyrinomonadaceae bacterium]|nr:hypothetical protein [Pyrinomonadaceae bacterium]
MPRILAVFILTLALVAGSSALSVAHVFHPTPQRQGDPSVIVWVNTSSGVYHCPGTRWYGKTKDGRYLSQKQAQAAGYRPANDSVCG